ncbi:hypothetical protein FGO68_gene1588 [Halteria grandinella]|uniref:Uncharacterized protein n=1 Tax=Halteria grandinella TaxID=5974 RepID=A0A8J8NBZ1_HALGN|nr:hypothetical protein FGO68_gene1588 [Halteria grandinella]
MDFLTQDVAWCKRFSSRSVFLRCFLKCEGQEVLLILSVLDTDLPADYYTHSPILSFSLSFKPSHSRYLVLPLSIFFNSRFIL